MQIIMNSVQEIILFIVIVGMIYIIELKMELLAIIALITAPIVLKLKEWFRNKKILENSTIYGIAQDNLDTPK